MLLLDLAYFLIILLYLPLFPLWIKFLLKKEYRDILRHRFSPNIKSSNNKRIWIHAVSVGEVRSLKYLIEKLKEKYKNKEIVLSVTTPSGFECAKDEFPGLAVINAPVDFSFIIKKFIKKINPQLLILNELEIWPNWIRITHREKVPVLLVNGRISELAFKRYKKTVFLLKGFLNKIDRYMVQAELYKKKFQQLGIPEEKLLVCGNIKADEAFNSLENLPPDSEIADFLGIRTGKNRKKIITVASSHLSDEQLIIPAINKLAEDFLFIIAPRHLNRVEEIEKRLANHRVEFSTWTKGKATPGTKTGSTLLFDRMGYLFKVLKISDIVFMGGTLERKIGGHNLYEPAVLGKLILGGPYYNNFPDIGEELATRGVYKIVRDTEEFQRMLPQCAAEMKQTAAAAVDAVSRRRGSTECILKEIQRLLP